MPFRGLVHFDAFGAFCPDALVHFGSGIQVQGEGLGIVNLIQIKVEIMLESTIPAN